jgi:DNA-binding transcriptional LysR family regulator
LAPRIYLGVDYVASINLRRIDLNLLTIFEAVYEEGSQQKASERLHLSQPAISTAISKFRHIANDKLFVGTKTMRPTLKADEIFGQVKVALDIIRQELFEKQDFDPRTTRRNFSIAIAYGGGFLLGQPIYQRLKEQAPNAKLTIRTVDPESEIPTLLRQQEIDLAISSQQFTDPMLGSEFCMEYEVAVAVRPEHPRIKDSPSIEEVLAERFLWVNGWGQAPELQDFIRAAEQRVEVEVPNILVIPPILLKTDLVALIPWHFGQRFAELYGIKTYKLPLEKISDRINYVWHRSYENDPELRWFREIAMGAMQKG